MREKILEVIMVIMVLGLCLLCAFALLGCTTIQAVPDDTLLEHNRRVTELERTIDDLTGRIERHGIEVRGIIADIGTVRERARGIASTTERIAYLFAEYERIVHELIGAYELLQTSLGGIPEGEQGFMDSLGNPYLD